MLNRFMISFSLLVLTIAIFFTPDLSAAIINAESCSLSHVNEAVTQASEGDTVLVPAGTCSWTGTLIISKTITLAGSGVGSTIINAALSSGGAMVGMKTGATRITGFTFDFSGPGYPIIMSPGGDDWRIDNCEFTTTGGKEAVIMVRGTQNDHPYGLIDNCRFYNGRIVVYGDAGYDAYVEWTDDRNFGSKEFIFIENCSFELGNGAIGNVADGNAGNKMVVRFSSFLNTRIEQHSVQGDLRGTKAFEIYNNSMQGGENVHMWAIWPRGGTGLIFNNRLSGYTNPIYFDNVRSYASRGSYFEACSGSSPVDGNQNSSGWPCRDQIGRGKDLTAWPGGPHPNPPYPEQESLPAYLWGNGFFVAVSAEGLTSEHIKKDRDFYEQNTSFNGTSGVGVGTYANRPSTCTPGVAYWATDRGSWNKSSSGGQGVLYKCVSADQWELYYTPYTYPHPLRAADSVVNIPDPPTLLGPTG